MRLRLYYLSTIVLLVSALLWHAATAWAGEPPTAPILRVETGMHTATIKRISIDAAGHYLATGSRDKTVRVWELASGRLLQTLRPPIDIGNEGRIYAVAISPDGNTIACGGATGGDWEGKNSIYVFDRATGRLIHRLAGQPGVISHLVFSPDGSRLAACLDGANGIRLYNTANYRKAERDEEKYGGGCYGAAFDSTGRLATTCYDGSIRLYDRQLKLLKKIAAPGSKQPYGIAFSPDDAAIAVGYENMPRVDVFSATDLEWRFSPDVTGIDNGSLDSVAWSADGALYAAGGWDREGFCPIRRWDAGGRGKPEDVTAAGDTIMFLAAWRGGVAFGAYDPAWGTVSAGRRDFFQPPLIAGYGALGNGFRLNFDGTAVAFGYDYEGKWPSCFALATRTLGTEIDASLQSPHTAAAPGLEVTEWQDKAAPKLNGQPLPLEQFELSQSLAVAPDGESFLLGCDSYLHCFHRSGKELWKKPAPGAAWAVNIAGNGKIGVAAFGDGTIRWFRMKDGQELLDFFPHPDRMRWVLWTPRGYYDCSPGGEDLIGWHVNHGKSQAADFFPASRFRDAYCRPDIVQAVLKELDEPKAIRAANEKVGIKERPGSLLEQLTPVVKVLEPQDGAELTSQVVKLRLSVRTPAGVPVRAVRILVNGQQAAELTNMQLMAKDDKGAELTIPVLIAAPGCQLSVLAEDTSGHFSKAEVVQWKLSQKSIRADVQVKPIPKSKPALYVMAVGIDNYNDKRLTLHWAAKDAADFVVALRGQKDKRYSEVNVLPPQLLTNAQVEQGRLEDELHNLRQTIDKAQSTDVVPDERPVVMLFFSGHGENDSLGHYYFLMHDYTAERPASTSFASHQLLAALGDLSLKSRVILFMDTCHAGNALEGGIASNFDRAINDLAQAERGFVVFTSCASSQTSFEKKEWRNGAFTKALVEGLNGGAEADAEGNIALSALHAYIRKRVPEILGNNNQTPALLLPLTVRDFTIARK